MSTVIIDEADSILIDEARVPLVLAGSIGDTDDESIAAATATLVATLRPGRDFNVVDDRRNVQLTNRGAVVVERAFGGIDLYDEDSLHRLTAVNQALHARALLTRDVDYIVRDGKVALVDEFRGRVAQPPALAGWVAGRGRGQGGPCRDGRRTGPRVDHRTGVHRVVSDRVRHDRHGDEDR